LGYPDAELTVVFVDDHEITDLNRRYLDRSGPTNVIAFPMAEGEFAELTPDVLGDVVVSADTAARDAQDGGYTVEEMLDFYTIHGILHLIGHDHIHDPAAAERMDAETFRLWRLIGHRD
jgi:probable rRNA maturation factor